MPAKIAVAGAGIYGTNIAIRLAEEGHQVRLFDPLGIMAAASAINQFRVHSGYHYPRSPETIDETLEVRAEFLRAYQAAIVQNTQHYYAIPKEGSQTPPDLFESVMSQHGVPFHSCRPEWMNFDFIGKCYAVDEHLYDPNILRNVIMERIRSLGIPFEKRAFSRSMHPGYDFVVYATYGLGPSRGILKSAKYQVAEKILIELPPLLREISLVIVDGPFTAFDPYGASGHSQFGSAKHTNHWTTIDAEEPIPEPYSSLLNGPHFQRVDFTRFEQMRRDSALAVPASEEAVYLGSRFTLRVVENNPKEDRRIIHMVEREPREIHIFSGKVVGALKATRLVAGRIAQ